MKLEYSQLESSKERGPNREVYFVLDDSETRIGEIVISVSAGEKVLVMEYVKTYVGFNTTQVRKILSLLKNLFPDQSILLGVRDYKKARNKPVVLNLK